MMHTHSLGRAAQLYPNSTALVRGAQRITFHELHDRIARLAATLHNHGLAFGDRLALLLPNGPEYLELIYACSWLGVVVVPINTRLSTVEIDHILMNAEAHGLVRHSSLPTPTERVPWQIVIDQEPLDLLEIPGPEPIYDPEAILALVYTSGTTGKPKGVTVTHANVLANIHFMNYWMPHQEGGVYLHAAPLFHIADFPSLFAAPAFGTAQVTIPKFSVQSFCESVEREHVSRTVLVPTMINLLTQFPDLGNYNLTSLERISYGGSPMAPELVKRIRKVLPNVKLVQGYGLSETGFLTGLQDHEHTPERLNSCGRTCPGIDLKVVDPSGKEMPVGQPGELAVRGANVMQGYWQNPDEPNRGFRDGLFRTGDIGYRDRDGYFFILDRLKDMIVTGGENVYSGEVEAVIYQHPAVREAAVFGIPDPNWGETVMACVALKPTQHLTETELITYCQRSLARYKVPRRVEFEAELPKGGSGKILKRDLRERFWNHQSRAVN